MANYSVITRKKDKGWQVIVSYKDMNGKWRQKSKQGFDTKRMAKDYAAVLIQQAGADAQLTNDIGMQNITLKDLYTLIMRGKINTLRPNTLQSYNQAFKNIEPLHNELVREITPQDIRKLLRESNKGTASQKYMLVILNQIFKSAVEEYAIIINNPVKGISVVDDTISRLRIIDDETFENILSNISPYHNNKYALNLALRTLYYTGMRRGELLGLTWDCVDWVNSAITVKQQLSLGRDGNYHLSPTKTANSVRTIPIPTHLRDDLLEHRDISDINAPIFSFSSPNILMYLIKQYAPQHSPHDFRHTYATKLLANGVDIQTVAALLGDTVNTVMNTYIHYSDEMRANASLKIAKIFKK